MTTPVTDGQRQRAHRGWTRLLVLLAVTVVAGVGFAGPAAAHNVLTSSDPEDGAVLQQSPTVVTLTFDQAVQDFQPVVTILGADGQRYESGAPAVDSTVVTQSVTTLTTPGPYTIAYRVVSADGHPVQGELRFELASPPPPSEPSSAPSSSAPSSSAPVAPSSSASTTPLSSAAATTAASSAAPSSAAASSAAVTTSTSSAAVAPAASSSGLSGWVWAAIAVAAALVATAIVVIVRRPKPTDGPGQPGQPG